jgi:hypothetical protein
MRKAVTRKLRRFAKYKTKRDVSEYEQWVNKKHKRAGMKLVEGPHTKYKLMKKVYRQRGWA